MFVVFLSCISYGAFLQNVALDTPMANLCMQLAGDVATVDDMKRPVPDVLEKFSNIPSSLKSGQSHFHGSVTLSESPVLPNIPSDGMMF